MRSLSIYMVSCFIAVSSFAQSNQTVTLVFVTAANDNYKNYEAVIDDVSYYSENTTDNNNRTSNNRNTIWLNNFQSGQHTIQVYSLKNGSNEERSNNTAIYSSTFNVRQGFDTKIAVRNNGQVQFSERQSAYNNSTTNQTTDTNNNGVYNRNTTNGNNGDYNNGTSNQNRRMTKRDRNNTNTNNDSDNGTVTNNGDSDGNYNNGTANRNGRMNRDRNDSNTNGGNEDQNNDYNRKMPMDDNQFSQLLETIRKQWIPGAKMSSVRNEFVVSGHYFTTMQAKQMIEFVTDENNRLQLAKASYRTITDPENFRQLYDVFKYQASKNEMDNYIMDYQY